MKSRGAIATRFSTVILSSRRSASNSTQNHSATLLQNVPLIEKPAILIAADGEIHAEETLAELLRFMNRFRYGTLVLPPGVGYLDSNGMVDWERSTADLSADELNRYDKSGTETRTRLHLPPGESIPPVPFRWRYTVTISSTDENDEG